MKPPRIAKYLNTLRAVALRYLVDNDFRSVTKESMIAIVANIERSNICDWSNLERYKEMLKQPEGLS